MNKTLKSMLLLASGIFLFALGTNLFLQPNNIVAGGFSGLAIVVNELTGMSTSVFYFITNVFLLILALFFLGRTFVVKTVVGATIFYPIALAIIPVYQVTTDPLINIVVAGTLFGIATILVYHSAGSGGGTVILGKIVHKFTNLSFGTSVAIFDLLIMTTGFIVFGFEDSMYGIFVIILTTMITNYGITGFKKLNQVQIISNEYAEITKKINLDVHRGVTLLNGEGGYTHEDKKVVMCVVDNNDLKRLKKIVSDIDAEAFMIVSQVSTTYGKGFEILIP